jgi:hypothetical protein
MSSKTKTVRRDGQVRDDAIASSQGGPMRWYLDALKKYATFSGRASRQEFWMFVLFNFIISFGLLVVDHVTGLTYWSFRPSTAVA